MAIDLNEKKVLVEKMSRISFFGQCIFEIIPPSEYLEYGSKADGEVLIINVPAYVLDYRSVDTYMDFGGKKSRTREITAPSACRADSAAESPASCAQP